MKYPHTRRGVVSFILLGIVTLGIYDLVLLSHVQKEINEIYGEEDKKSSPFWISWAFGWISLGIVPLIWCCKVAEKIHVLQDAMALPKPKTSFASLFNWSVFGLFILVGPWIGWHNFFVSLNKIEEALNAGEAAKVVEPEVEQQKKLLNVPIVDQNAKNDNSTLIIQGTDVSVSQHEEAGQTVVEVTLPPVNNPAPAENVSAETVEAKPVKVKPYSYVAPEAPTPEASIHKEAQNDETPKAYKPAPKQVIKKWQVRYADRKDAIKYFSTEEEAIAFAKSIAMAKGLSVRVKDKEKPIK